MASWLERLGLSTAPQDISNLEAELTAFRGSAADFISRFDEERVYFVADGKPVTEKRIHALGKLSDVCYAWQKDKLYPAPEGITALLRALEAVTMPVAFGQSLGESRNKTPPLSADDLDVFQCKLEKFMATDVNARFKKAGAVDWPAVQAKTSLRNEHAFVQACRQVIMQIPAMKAHPFVTEFSPQIPVLSAKAKQRNAIARAEYQAKADWRGRKADQLIADILAKPGQYPNPSHLRLVRGSDEGSEPPERDEGSKTR